LADVFNDAAMAVELASPLVGSSVSFTWVACGASLLRAVVAVSGGATRAAITEHQAIDDNVSEVSAKDGSQETAVTLLGVVVGLIVAPLLDVAPLGAIWALFVALVALHLAANYMAVRAVVLSQFNGQRLAIVFDEFARSGRLLTPAETADRERILCWQSLRGGHPHVQLGVRLQSLGADAADMAAQQAARHRNYVERNGRIALASQATSRDVLRAYFAQHFRSSSSAPSFGALLALIEDSEWQLTPLKLNIGSWRYVVDSKGD
jgi:Vitamin B6 photo-protection and homoeostasis